MSAKISVFKFSHFEAELALAVGLVILMGLIFYTIANSLYQAGSSLADILKSDQSKIAIVLLVFIATVVLALVYAKIDEPITLLSMGICVAGVTAILLYYNDIFGAIGGIFTSSTVTQSNVKQKIIELVYKEYANPVKNEVYFPGDSNVKKYAETAGVNLSATIGSKDFIVVVYTDRVWKIIEGTDDPKVVWNYIYYNNVYPITVVYNGHIYTVYCKCDMRECNWLINSRVCCPSGKCYDCNNEYRHMPKNDALYILTHPPWP